MLSLQKVHYQAHAGDHCVNGWLVMALCVDAYDG